MLAALKLVVELYQQVCFSIFLYGSYPVKTTEVLNSLTEKSLHGWTGHT